MPFPEVERVRFKNCPLVEVVCQIRFPTILSIDASQPVDFQTEIRHLFPIYEEIIEQQQQISFDPTNPGLIMQPMVTSNSNKNFKFTSTDGRYWVNLTRNFISLSTNDYKSWEEFCGMLFEPFKALHKTYTPAFYDRIGLRYVDVFCRENIGLKGVSWSELFQPQILGLIDCENELNTNIDSHNQVDEIILADGVSMLRLNSSVVVQADKVFQDKDTERCFMIDGDFFNMERFVDYQNVCEKLEFLHLRSTRLIRWLIKEKLFLALEPEAI